MNATQNDHEGLIWSLMHDTFDGLDDEGREAFSHDLEELYSLETLVRDFRTMEQLVEGLCIGVEDLSPVALLVMSDCLRRVRRALDLAERVAGE